MENYEEWLFWDDEARDPYLNMAIDESLLVFIPTIALPVIRFYRWDRPSVTIGYIQDFNAAPKSIYTVVRRITGGGVVFHDCDFTYSVIIPSSHPIVNLPRIETYHLFHKIIIAVLARFNIEAKLTVGDKQRINRSFMHCFNTPTRYDVIGNDGRKYAGAAQRRTKAGILHQGSISLKNAGINDREKLKEYFLNYLGLNLYKDIKPSEKGERLSIKFKIFNPDQSLLRNATELAKRKYSTKNWNMLKNYEE